MIIMSLNRHSPCFLRIYDFSEGDKESKNNPKDCIITNWDECSVGEEHDSLSGYNQMSLT